MKYCSKCGRELLDEAIVCPGCGCAVSNANQASDANSSTPVQQGSNAPIVLGIVGIIFAWIFALVGHITSIIGIIVGIKEYRNSGKMTGLTLSIIGEVCAIFSSIIGAATMAAL